MIIWNNDTSGIMRPAVRLGDPRALILQDMILLHGVTLYDPGRALVVGDRHFRSSRLVVFVEDDRAVRVELSGPVDPHRALCSPYCRIVLLPGCDCQ